LFVCSFIYFLFSFMSRRPPSSPLFPYTTLFRSQEWQSARGDWQRQGDWHTFVAATGHSRDFEPGVGVSEADNEGLGLSLGTSYRDRKSTRLNSSHVKISYAVFCLKKKKNTKRK